MHVDDQPAFKRWTCWHEAGHIICAYAVGGIVQEVALRPHFHGRELNMSVAWGVIDPRDSKVVCAAGAVIDDLYGPEFTNEQDHIQCKRLQDRDELRRLIEERDGTSMKPPDVAQEFAEGYAGAERILLRSRTRVVTQHVRDYILDEFYRGTETLTQFAVESCIAESIGLPHTHRKPMWERLRSNLG